MTTKSLNQVRRNSQEIKAFHEINYKKLSADYGIRDLDALKWLFVFEVEELSPFA